jgi:exosortase N
MEAVKNIKILRGGIFIPLFFLFAILMLWMANGYLFINSTFIIGLMMLPYLTIIKNVNKKNGVYVFFTILSLVASLYLPSRTLHFFTLAFGALALIEMQYGRLSLLPLFAVILTSSLVTNFSLVFSFPIRLKISDLAAKILSFFDSTAKAEGNIIHFKGTDFSVDTACMGLMMLQMSMLLALFLIAYFEPENRANFTPLCCHAIARNDSHVPRNDIFRIFTILVITLGLNVFFNLIRIILLVLFGWMPDTFMHDAAGLVGLGLHVFLPLYFIVKHWFWILKHFGKARKSPLLLKGSSFQPSLKFATFVKTILSKNPKFQPFPNVLPFRGRGFFKPFFRNLKEKTLVQMKINEGY